jgi:hypothetical protein
MKKFFGIIVVGMLSIALVGAQEVTSVDLLSAKSPKLNVQNIA